MTYPRCTVSDRDPVHSGFSLLHGGSHVITDRDRVVWSRQLLHLVAPHLSAPTGPSARLSSVTISPSTERDDDRASAIGIYHGWQRDDGWVDC